MSELQHAPELLAPAGDWQALRAAVANGADAVYFGLTNFNARHRASNFEPEELPEVMGYLRARQVRGYVTFNTLVFSDELCEAARLIEAIAAAGVDAVIVQDLGLAALCQRLAPGLPVHGSTQMTLTEPLGVEFVRRLGVERVILARELGIAEIEQIAHATTVPLEVFVHGALCVAYSGQCLTSEALGGRSANRGQCAQACRLPYDLLVDGEQRELGDRSYLLSPQDLAAYDLIDELARLGLASLKIEGRLKSAEYVAVTTQTYRAAIDAAQQRQQFELSAAARRDLAQSFSRGFSRGFLAGIDHQTLVEGRFPKSRGVRVGRVVGKTRHGVNVAFESDFDALPLQPGDGVVFDQGHPEQDEQGGRVFSVDPIDNGQRQTLQAHVGLSREGVNLAAIETGALVWKTDDPALRRRLQRSYSADRPLRRWPIDVTVVGAVGAALQITATLPGGASAQAEWAGPLQLAQKHVLSEATFREQFGRLGETNFSLAGVQLRLADEVMVPKSVLNDLRRKVVEQLSAQIEHAGVHPIENPGALEEWRSAIATGSVATQAADESPQMRVLVRSLDQLDAVLDWANDRAALAGVCCDFEDARRYGAAVSQARAAGVPIAVATLRIMKPGELGFVRQIIRSEPDEVLVRNLGSIEYLQQHAPALRLVGDYSLNVANELTADLMFAAGLVRQVPSYDLSWEQFEALVRHSEPARFEAVVHQHLPMFHMEHCVFAALLSDGKDWRDCGRPCDHHRVELRDRVGADLPVLADAGCRNTVYNAVAQSAAEYVPRMRELGVRHFRVELLRESGEEIAEVLNQYAGVISGISSGRNTWRQLQVLNQLGVTRGTMRRS